MKEKVDVLVATYNGEKYLREQLDSIIKQTYKNIRILISDDCSKDRTQEILQEYEKKDDRIKIFLHDRNLGSNKNFEFLLRQVESKFYMLSDQDDVWLPEKIEKTIQKQKETGADLVFGDLEVVNEKLETEINGVYAIGDIINKDTYQLVTAAADGARVITNMK